MENPRKYGNAPFNVAVIHGGPGAPGEMAPVARELSPDRGVLEPLQTAASLEGQLRELQAILKKDAALPVTLIGHSWGAMLGFIFSARYPSFVKKLILIGSGVYEEKYAMKIMETRLSRLGKEERSKVLALMETLNDPTIEDKDKNMPFSQLGKLISGADSYNPLLRYKEISKCQYGVHQSVWKQARELRGSGELLTLGKHIQCPVVAIHGDYDPHPGEGVEEPLALVLKDFQFISLKNCGHSPWIERDARERFYSILKQELHKSP